MRSCRLCFFALRFCFRASLLSVCLWLVFVLSDILVAKTAIVWRVEVVFCIVGLRMCRGAQCFASIGGCSVLVRISAVLLAEETPPILMLFCT